MNKIKHAEAEFVYHNVGQGLFYSGEIKLQNQKNVNVSNNTFRFVYDCGSENRNLVNTSVRRYKQDVKDDKIDLLVISHLHSDHVNGLEELFKNFKIKDVILPYLTPIERLLIALRKTNMPQWYYEFLSDPVSYLMEKGVNRVIIIGSEESNGRPPFPEDIPPYNPEAEPLNIDKLSDDEELKEEIGKHDKNWIKYINKKLLIKNHNGYILAQNLWLFRFFNYKITSSSLEQFHYCISNLINNYNIYDIKSLIKYIKILINEYKESLKKCYNEIKKQLKNDFNNTSLVLYHGPVNNLRDSTLRLAGYCIYDRCKCYLNKYTHFPHSFGQLLTGDIDLNMRFDELKEHYSNYLDRVVAVQVPHHGARKNWNRNILEEVSNGKFWIISAGLKNRYGHPSCKVIGDILCNDKQYIWVNETNCAVMKGEIDWY